MTLDEVRAAAALLDGVAHRTPVIRSRTLDAAVGAEVFAKCENLQRTGSFKFRGAYTAVCRLDAAQRARGVVTYSSGNHGAALALAARELGTSATVVMPIDAPASKAAAVAGYGAEVVTYDRYTGDRVAIAQALAADRGSTLVPPFDHPDVIAGQGTAALELLHDVPDLDAVVVPVGGGGLAAGTAVAARGVSGRVQVIGVEPAAGDDTARSLAAGHRVRIAVPRTIADGQAVDEPGELTFPILARLLEAVVTVTDAQIVEAMRFAFERLKLVVEPSGATPLAALLTGQLQGARVGAIVSGGNVDAVRFADLCLTSRPGDGA